MVGASRNESVRRRESFDVVADSYDAYRPSPPPEVIEAVIASSELDRGSRVLEIGCGTGQLSLHLARHGVDLVAVELGANLAALARKNLARFPEARIEVGSFESWQLPSRKFDAVVCANAFHWLDPDIRFAKSAEALRPGGFLTILHVHHVSGGTPGFVADTQTSYLKWGLSDDPSFEPPAPHDVPAMYPELDGWAEFDSVKRTRFEGTIHHTTTSYVGWLGTDSLVNGLAEEQRRGFLQDIERLIESRYSGVVSRNFVYEVIAAKRAA
jgi:SAM-dependent methyltransferase